ncbi:Cleavage/polyadenylation specificity factor, A subunit, partial [Collybia nuda]
MQDSVSFVTYNASENRLVVFSDDTQPRWVTCSTMVDYNTVAATDRFGNIFVDRLDSTTSDQVDDNPSGFGRRRDNKTPFKTKLLGHFHVGDITTSLHKTPLEAGGREVLLYTALHGTIGALVPFTSREDNNLLTLLEQHMRAEKVSLVGHDHLGWRGYYVPVKAVVNGDLCESYDMLDVPQEVMISNALNRSVEEVLETLSRLR